MKILSFIKSELNYYSVFEKYFFLTVLLITFSVSYFAHDDKIALISALCGISYTFFAGKGKIYCYYTGLIGTFCYCYIAYKNGFFGNLALYGGYFLPMEIIGIIKWKKHLKKDKNEIIKTVLSKKERILYFSTVLIISIISGFLANSISGWNYPFLDITTVIFSILGQLLTVKRCYEQWWVWIFVNIVSFIMWNIAYFINNSHALNTVFMWFVYIFLAFYFKYKWKKELKL